MVSEKYIDRISAIMKKHLTQGEKVFIFGSSVDSERFGDVDLAVVSEQPVDSAVIYRIKEDLEESTLPYKFDVVDINNTKDPFRSRVLNGPKIWII